MNFLCRVRLFFLTGFFEESTIVCFVDRCLRLLNWQFEAAIRTLEQGSAGRKIEFCAALAACMLFYGCRFQVTGSKSQVTGCRLQVTGYRFQVLACNIQPVTCNRYRCGLNGLGVWWQGRWNTGENRRQCRNLACRHPLRHSLCPNQRLLRQPSCRSLRCQSLHIERAGLHPFDNSIVGRCYRDGRRRGCGCRSDRLLS